MNTERPHDIRRWDELSDNERQRYTPIPADQEDAVKAMTEDERHSWWMSRKLRMLFDEKKP